MAEANANIVEHFSEVLKLSNLQTIDIIRHLDQKSQDNSYFTKCLSLLKPLTKSDSGNIQMARSNNNIVENRIVKPRLGKGSYGEVSLSAKGLIYKEIRLQRANPYYLEYNLREIFLEVFIQTVLSLDIQFEGRIPRIFHLYRSSNTPEREILLYVVMENVPTSLKKYIYKQLKTKGVFKLNLEDITPIFVQLGSLLNELQTKYEFYHRDLHGGNIMFNENGNLNIIDFGKACLTINGITYSIDKGNCISWDLLILFTYLLQREYAAFNKDVLDIFRNILTSANGIDFYDYVIGLGYREHVPPFHAVYPDFIDKFWGDVELNALIHDSPLLEPYNFTNFMLEHISESNTHSPLLRQSPQRNLLITPEKIGGLYRMAKNYSRKCNRKTKRNMRKNHRGGDYQTSQQWFDPDVLPPATVLPAVSTAPTPYEIRPVLMSTFQSAGGRKTRRHGGFSPSIMGGFVANAQSAIVPLALYAVYHTMIPKTGTAKLGGLFKNMTRKNRRNSRK